MRPPLPPRDLVPVDEERLRIGAVQACEPDAAHAWRHEDQALEPREGALLLCAGSAASGEGEEPDHLIPSERDQAVRESAKGVLDRSLPSAEMKDAPEPVPTDILVPSDIIRSYGGANLKVQRAHEVTLTDRATKPLMDSIEVLRAI